MDNLIKKVNVDLKNTEYSIDKRVIQFQLIILIKMQMIMLNKFYYKL